MMDNEHLIIEDYQILQSLRETAKRHYCSQEAVRLVLIRHDVPRGRCGRKSILACEQQYAVR